MSFSFTLDSLSITNTRSAHTDTNYVVFTLQVGSQQFQPQVKSMGSINNGSHAIGIGFQNVTVNPTDTVILNYIVVNAGTESRVDAETALERVGRSLASGTGNAPTPPELVSGMTAQPVLDWLGLQLQGIYKPGSCDGLVAVEQDSFTFADLSQRTSTGSFSHTTQHLGTQPPAGCNKNASGYSVTWHMLNQAAFAQVPSVITDFPAQAKTDLAAAGFVAVIPQGTPVTASVVSQQPGPLSMALIGTPVTLTFGKQIHPPSATA